jgi:hypothetical protein
MIMERPSILKGLHIKISNLTLTVIKINQYPIFLKNRQSLFRISIKGTPMALIDRLNLLLRIGLVLTALTLGSCSPQQVGPIGPSTERLTWPEMSIEQKKEHMANVVLPRAAEVFRTWRPDRFAQVDCTLCHGSGPITGNFHMPSAHLPRLSGEVLLGPELEKDPDTTRFKLNRLVPVMSEALGLSSFNIITQRGFGCYSCHFGPQGPMFGH